MSDYEEDAARELYWACKRGDVEKVSQILQHGIDVNILHLGREPLHWAASEGHVGVAELLLKAGAQVDSRDTYGKAPLHWAASEGHVGVADLLLKAGAQVDIGDTDERAPLHLAAWGGHVGVAELFLKAGAQVDIRDEYGREPLHWAAIGGHVGVAELLIKVGAQVDSRSTFGRAPLHEAASRGHVGVAKLLLKAGAQVDSRGEYGREPLHLAAEGGHVGVAELLLKAGAQVDSRDGDGDTPLSLAASEGHIGVTEILLTAGAQMDSENKDGKTPQDIAASKDVRYPFRTENKNRILKGRKMILELFETGKVMGPVCCTVGPKGVELQTASCTVSVPRDALSMETQITCQALNPNDVTLPLKDGEMLVSDIIELGPHGKTFNEPVTVKLQYNNTSSGGAREAVMWVTEDYSQWSELETSKQSEDKLEAKVNHFSAFAVVSQPTKEQFSVTTQQCTLTSSTQPAVQISFPEQSVETPTQVKIQVQDVSKETVEDMKANDKSSRGLVRSSPIVEVELVEDSTVNFNRPVTVRVPHPRHYMNIQHGGSTDLRIMSRDEGAENWVDVTNDVNYRLVREFVEFDVTHFSSYVVLEVKTSEGNIEQLGPIPLKLCKWIQQHEVKFILLQQEDNPNALLIECLEAKNADKKHAKLKNQGYTGPAPSERVKLREGQKVEVGLVGNVSFAPFSRDKHITFHSKMKDNRLNIVAMPMEVKGNKALEGLGFAQFTALPQIFVEKKKEKKARAASAHKTTDEKEPPRPKLLCNIPMKVPSSSQRFEKQTSEEEAAGGQTIDRYFYFIKEEVSTDWIDVAFHLGFKGAAIKNIQGRNRDDKSCCMDMLWEWKKRKGDAATIEVLMEALSEAELKNVVDGLRSKFEDLKIK